MVLYIPPCRDLDYDLIDRRRYQFQVLAKDQGVPQNTGSATVQIWMENVDDQPPVFTPNEQKVNTVLCIKTGL